MYNDDVSTIKLLELKYIDVYLYLYVRTGCREMVSRNGVFFREPFGYQKETGYHLPASFALLLHIKCLMQQKIIIHSLTRQTALNSREAIFQPCPSVDTQFILGSLGTRSISRFKVPCFVAYSSDKASLSIRVIWSRDTSGMNYRQPDQKTNCHQCHGSP